MNSIPQHGNMLRSPASTESSPLFRRYTQLTMPAGALDALLLPALKINAQRVDGDSSPLSVGFLLFAGDHAVARQHGVSAYPAEVTPQMVANIASGGAAISQLTARRGSPLIVCDVGVARGFEEIMAVRSADNIQLVRANLDKAFPDGEFASGARDISRMSALTEDAYGHCWKAGADCVDLLLAKHSCDVIALGEMGIGNTTPASALAAVMTGHSVEVCAGRGTGVDDLGLGRKRKIIAEAVSRALPVLDKLPKFSLQWSHALMQELGGAELCALAGAAWRAAERGKPVLLDGLIVTSAVAPFAYADKTFAQWMMASHESAEPAHSVLLNDLRLQPLLRLGLRLGEGSGAALAAGLLQDADALLRSMATFEAAGVSSI
ncbi:MAG: nicotinate-nucleotide--dimethylbenzimidazole phosphoribosyltransferase [Proteobacteria bacterium]|nr:nicotinate-nucleotide--dimethylbenzimidazole phosphoribosyltransferase [Pseudomonadota bacterium]